MLEGGFNRGGGVVYSSCTEVEWKETLIYYELSAF